MRTSTPGASDFSACVFRVTDSAGERASLRVFLAQARYLIGLGSMVCMSEVARIILSSKVTREL